MTVTSSKRERISVICFIISVVLISTISPALSGELLDMTADQYRAKGYEAQLKGNYDQALVNYLKAITLTENRAALYNDVGIVYEQLGIQDRAQYSYEQAISYDPNYLPPYANLGYFFKAKGDTNNALFYFRERLNRAPVDDPRRSQIQNEIFALDPGFKDRVIRAEMEGAKQKMEEKARENFDDDISRAEGHYQRGVEFFEKQEFDRALKEFDRALNLTPNNPKIIRERQRAVEAEKVQQVKNRLQDSLQKLDAGEWDNARNEIKGILSIIPSAPTLNAQE